jgi:hypothetical protein
VVIHTRNLERIAEADRGAIRTRITTRPRPWTPARESHGFDGQIAAAWRLAGRRRCEFETEA